MRKLLRSIMKVPDASGSFSGDRKTLADNFHEVYHASDLEWTGAEQDIWNCIRGFWIEHHDVPTPDDVKSMLEFDFKADSKVVVDEITVLPFIETASVSFHITEIRTERKKRDFLISAKQAMLIAVQGQKIEHQTLKGVPDAVRFLMGKAVPLLATSQSGKVGGSPREDATEMREKFLESAENPGKTIGILTGIDRVDQVTYGMRRGNLVIVAAFMSDGKTTIKANIVYNAVFRQGFNAVFFSREMTYDQIRTLFYVLHSNHPRFAKVHEPLKYEDIVRGILPKDGREFYLDCVIPDFATNTEYGDLFIEPPSPVLTVTDVRVKAEFLNLSRPIDLICVDYLTLLDGEVGRRYSDDKARMNELYVAAKQLALSFNDGQGCVFLTGHQVNRKGKTDAEEDQGVYRIQALSDAHEAERSGDIIIANYLDMDLRAMNESKVTMLKNREGKVVDPFNMVMKLEHRFIGNLTDAVTTGDQLLDLEF